VAILASVLSRDPEQLVPEVEAMWQAAKSEHSFKFS
jgi:hypothetical protein